MTRNTSKASLIVSGLLSMILLCSVVWLDVVEKFLKEFGCAELPRITYLFLYYRWPSFILGVIPVVLIFSYLFLDNKKHYKVRNLLGNSAFVFSFLGIVVLCIAMFIPIIQMREQLLIK